MTTRATLDYAIDLGNVVVETHPPFLPLLDRKFAHLGHTNRSRTMSVTLRAATADDAERVALLGREFVAYLRSLGDPRPCSLSTEQYLRDGFGQDPAFSGLIAEMDGEMVGFLLYCPSYDLDLGGRIFYIIDLFVREGARRQGVARALMEAVAKICRQAGGKQLLWAVYAPNALAKDFYEKLGATYIRDLQFMRLPV